MRVVTDEELRLRELPVVPDVVPGLLQVGASVLYADPGLGKSMIAQACEHHLAYGRPFGGWEVEEPVRCLVVDFEGDESLTQERGFAISPFGTVPTDRGESAPGQLVHVFDMPGASFAERFLELRVLLEEAAAANWPFRYVRIDTLGDFFGAKPRDEDAYSYSKRLMTSLNKLATDHNLALLLIHHTNKSGQYSGSIGIGGGGVCVMKLHRNEDNEFEAFLESEKVRRGAPFRHALIQSPDDGTWTFTDAITPTQAATAGTNRLVVDALTTKGPLTKRELQSTLYDLPKVTLRGAMDRLAAKRVIRFYRGRWELVPTGAAPVPARVCDVCRGRLVVSDVGATVHPTCAEAPTTEDPEVEAARVSGLKLMTASLEASRMHPVPRIPPAGRELAPWSLMSELMAGEHRWELALDADRAKGVVAVLDRNGSYPSAAGSVLVSPGVLAHTGGLEERGDRAGIFLIEPFAWKDAMIGHPLGRIAEQPGPWWVTTPHLDMLEKRAERLGIKAPVVIDSWTGRATGGLFTSFSKDVQTERLRAKLAGDTEGYLHVKRSTSQAIRLLWPKQARSPFWRPDWSLSIRAEASVRHWVKAWEATRMGANLVRLGSVDEAAFLAPVGADSSWVPRPYKLGDTYGCVKHKDDVLVAGAPVPSPLTVEQWTKRGRRARG